MNWVRDRIMFDGCFIVPSEGGERVWPFFGKQVLMCGWIVFQITILMLLFMVVQKMHGD